MLDNLHIVFRSNWGLAVVFLLTAAVLVLAWHWNRPTRAALSRRLYRVVAVAQVLAALLVALWLVNPRLRYARNWAEDASLAVLVDTSMSMANRDMGDGESRFETARRILLAPDASLRGKLDEKAEIRFYSFSAGLRETPDSRLPPGPDPAGLTTDISGAMQSLAADVRGKHIRGVVLATDGVDTGGGDLKRIARDLQAPVYAIGIGQKSDPGNPWRNVGIVSVDVPTRVNLGQEVEVKVHLSQEGYGGEDLQVELLEEGGPIDTENLPLSDAPRQMARLSFKPERKGTRNYSVALRAPSGDRVEPDNRLDFTVLVSEETIRVLYVEGTLRWVYKFARRTLEHEESIELDTVIRTGGGKLYMQAENDLTLQGPLPGDLDGLKQYDVIILGDFPRSLLPDGQLKLLERYVKEEKGGLLVIGGPETLHSGAYKGSSLESLLPVRLGETRTLAPVGGGGLMSRVTPRGQSSSVLRGLEKDLDGLALAGVY
ncbi:hypothetical protein HQ520_04715, partial [bacterium]|nr:hypothetical protein [bacterium]